MTTYAWPTGREWLPRAMSLMLEPNVRSFVSPYTRSSQMIDLLGEAWVMTMTLGERKHAAGAAREAFLAKLRGGVHTVNLWHFRRPTPRGTLRGALTLAAQAAQGAQTLSVTGGAGQANRTLLAGDMLGLAGQLLMVSQDCQANGSGVISVPLANRVRSTQPATTAVSWDRPVSQFRLVSPVPVGYRPGATDDIELEWREHWA